LFGLSLAASITANLAFGPALALVLKILTDAIVARRSAGVVQAAWGMALVALAMGIGSFIGQYALRRFSEHVSLHLRKRILGRALRAPLPYLESRPSSDLVSCLVNDVESTKQAFATLQTLVANVVLVAASLATLFATSWPVALTVLFLAFLCGSTGGVFSRPVKKISDLYQANLARIMETATAIFTGLAVVKSLEKEDVLAGKFGHVSELQYETGRKRGKIFAAQESLSGLVTEMSAVILLLVAGVMTLSGRITPGQAVGLVQLGSMILWPLAGLGGQWASLHQFLAGTSRVLQALEAPQEDDGVRQGERVEGERGGLPPAGPVDAQVAVSFDRVSFGYSDEKMILTETSFSVRQGQKAVIMGPSGSGKTTLSKLLLRFHDPQEGAITVFGRDTRRVPLRELRRQIAFVPQEPWIFPGTVRANIVLGNPEAGVEEVIRASAAAQAHAFISELPGGYDCMLEEGGKNLSGGQKQRLCLARALLKKAPILLLDEPTSAVDTESARLINQAIKDLGSDRTVIVISHTPEMMKDADVILALKDGIVVASPPDPAEA